VSADLAAAVTKRWHFRLDDSSTGRWWYVVRVVGAHGAEYEVEVTLADGRTRPFPFKATRLGIAGTKSRSTRTIGYRGGLKEKLYAAAEEAVRADVAHRAAVEVAA
jgi:hypothetical protein